MIGYVMGVTMCYAIYAVLASIDGGALCIVPLAVGIILGWLAMTEEEKLLKRIKKLEEQLNDKEERK